MKTVNSVTDTSKNKIEPSTLYIVATPIGNLSDITFRAVKVLSEVDFIAAEDTRVTGKLLSALDISKQMISYHEHNMNDKHDYIIKRIKSGESCALVTDAGTPAISDPGYNLVRLCIDENIKITSIPGASAAITALTLAGIDTSQFMFIGFINKLDKSKIERISTYDCTLIFYESPHRIKETLKLLYDLLGKRKMTICRELTKLNEELIYTTTTEAVHLYDKVESEPRGEYVIVIEKGIDETPFWIGLSVTEHAAYYTNNLNYTKNEAIKAVARDRKVSKNQIYKEFIN